MSAGVSLKTPYFMGIVFLFYVSTFWARKSVQNFPFSKENVHAHPNNCADSPMDLKNLHLLVYLLPKLTCISPKMI